MRRYTIFFLLASVVAGFASCNNVDITPDTPEQPSVSKYEQLTFSTADDDAAKAATRAVWSDPNGKGNLIFNWEEDNAGIEVVALLTGEDSFIPNYPSENPSADELNDIKYHTYMTISPQEDLHKADFKTVRYYNKGDKETATAVYAVTPVNDFCIFEADETSFSAQMEMPASFVQSFSQTPEFLCDYMMMYGLGEFENGSASISFKHIPATFRFIITNMRPTTARLENVSLSVDGGAPIGSNYAEVHGDYTTESLYVDFAGNHTSITTLLNTTLESQETYTAYAMALPLGNNETLEDKDIKFVITTEEHGFLSFVLTGSQIANANKSYGEDIYNWVGGKSYTIRMSLSDVLTFDGITVEDWNKETIDGGEAEESEWGNGINIFTGEYEPARQNAEGEYEVANAGNLMWMSQQINARTLSIPYTIKLVDDITIGENLEWIPIAHPDGTQNSSVFDGNGHTLTINQNRPTATDAGFGIFQSFNYSTVKDLTIKGDIVLNTTGHIGAIASTTYRTTISRVISYANITNLSGSGRVGGLVGQFGGQHSGGKYSLIENCAVYANVSGDIAGGIIGYGWAGYQYYDIKNSAFYGDVTGTTHQGAIIGYHANNQTATHCTFKHIYYYEKDALGFSGGGNTNYTLGADVIAKTPAEFASVTMAEQLNADQANGPWEYVIGNLYPTLKK